MNTKNNKRRQASQEKIETVFLRLLQEKSLSQITVSDICQQTGLNRSTFYANYADVYALADTIRDRLEQQVSMLYRGDIVPCGLDYLLLFRHIRDNQIFYSTYFKLGYDHTHVLELEQIAQRNRSFPGEHLRYHVQFHKAGLNAIIKLWLSQGCRETPEEMVAILQSEYQGRT